MTRPAVRFARSSDGGTVAFSVAGTGHPFLLFTGPRNAALEWEMPTFAPFLEALAQHLTVVLIAVRGNPTSDPAPPHRKLADYALDDVISVVETLGFPRYAAAVVGPWSQQLAALAVRDADRLSHLVFQHPRTSPIETSWPASVRAHEQVAAAYGRSSVSLRALVDLGPLASPEQLAGVERFVQANHNCPHFHLFREKIDERNREIDLRRYLPLIKQPTLVFADEGAPGEGIALAAGIEGAQLRRAPNIPSRMTDPRESRATAAEIIKFICNTNPQPVSLMAAPDVLNGLTAREQQVLSAIAHGRRNSEIAAEMDLSEATIARHVSNIYSKLGVRNRAEATSRFLSSSPGARDRL